MADNFWDGILDDVRTEVETELKQVDFYIENNLHKNEAIFNIIVVEKSYEFIEILLKNGAMPTKTTILIAIKDNAGYIVNLLLRYYIGQVTEEML